MKFGQKIRERANKAVTTSKKYAWRILLAAALVLGGFLIGRPAISIIKSNREIAKLREEKVALQEDILQNNTFNENLNNNDEFLVQFAREKYNMHEKGEDIFTTKE
jgi:cell division protein FtsB